MAIFSNSFGKLKLAKGYVAKVGDLMLRVFLLSLCSLAH
jgi:hypothetical protein